MTAIPLQVQSILKYFFILFVWIPLRKVEGGLFFTDEEAGGASSWLTAALQSILLFSLQSTVPDFTYSPFYLLRPGLSDLPRLALTCDSLEQL